MGDDQISCGAENSCKEHLPEDTEKCIEIDVGVDQIFRQMQAYQSASAEREILRMTETIFLSSR